MSQYNGPFAEQFAEQVADIKRDIKKLIEHADVDSLKKELHRFAGEVKKRGTTEVKHLEKSVRLVRVRVLKLQKQIESEVTKIRKIVAGRKKSSGGSTVRAKSKGVKKTTTRATPVARKKTTRKPRA